MKKRAVVDRVENGKIILIFDQHSEQVILPRGLLSAAKEGDVIDVSFNINKASRLKKQAQIDTIIKDLQEQDSDN